MLEYLGWLAPVSVAFFILLARRLPAYPRQEYGWPDAGLVALLIAWFGLNIAASFGRKLAINTNAIVLSIVLYACIVILIVGFLVFRNRNPVKLWGLNWPGWRQGLPFALLALVLAYPALIAALFIARKSGLGTAPQDLVEYLLATKHWPDKAVLIFMAVVAAPVAEETIFRGYLHGVFRTYAGRWPAAMLNSLLFAAIHGHAPSVGALFLLAMAFTLVYERTGSLWASIFMHAAFNAVTVTAALFFPQLVQ